MERSRRCRWIGDETKFIDSPLQNLALLKDLLDGTSALTGAGVTTGVSDLAAMLLGAASDKTVPISVDTVIAVTTILGTPVTGAAAAQLAAEAEAIRIAILAGHGWSWLTDFRHPNGQDAIFPV